MQMTWQTNFLIASSKPSTLVTRSACVQNAKTLSTLPSSPVRESAARRPWTDTSRAGQQGRAMSSPAARPAPPSKERDEQICSSKNTVTWLRRHLQRTKSVWGRLARAFRRIFTTTCILSGTFTKQFTRMHLRKLGQNENTPHGISFPPSCPCELGWTGRASARPGLLPSHTLWSEMCQ